MIASLTRSLVKVFVDVVSIPFRKAWNVGFEICLICPPNVLPIVGVSRWSEAKVGFSFPVSRVMYYPMPHGGKVGYLVLFIAKGSKLLDEQAKEG